MQQPADDDGGTQDVLSIGEGRDSRWGRLGAVVLALLVGFGGYRLVTAPEPRATPPAAVAEEQPRGSVARQPPAWVLDERERVRDGHRNPTMRLGGELVTLHGPGLREPGREVAATALRRIPRGWLVRVTSGACEDPTDTRTSYGAARLTGRFTPWDPPRTRAGGAWRSPDRTLVLVVDGNRIELRRARAASSDAAGS